MTKTHGLFALAKFLLFMHRESKTVPCLFLQRLRQFCIDFFTVLSLLLTCCWKWFAYHQFFVIQTKTHKKKLGAYLKQQLIEVSCTGEQHDNNIAAIDQWQNICSLAYIRYDTLRQITCGHKGKTVTEIRIKLTDVFAKIKLVRFFNSQCRLHYICCSTKWTVDVDSKNVSIAINCCYSS